MSFKSFVPVAAIVSLGLMTAACGNNPAPRSPALSSAAWVALPSVRPPRRVAITKQDKELGEACLRA